MVAITPDSPIGAVFGSSHKKRKLAEEGLGLRTVGDLLRHFPRRYVAATELSEVATPVVGEQLTIVGEVRSCSSSCSRGAVPRTASRVPARVPVGPTGC